MKRFIKTILALALTIIFTASCTIVPISQNDASYEKADIQHPSNDTKNNGTVSKIEIETDTEAEETALTYTLVEPTAQEVLDIKTRLFMPLCYYIDYDFNHLKYDCNTDNIHKKIYYNDGSINYTKTPSYNDEIDQFIEPEWGYKDAHFGWSMHLDDEVIIELAKEAFADDGSVSDDIINEQFENICGYWMHSPKVYDWLTKEFWNCKANADDFFKIYTEELPPNHLRSFSGYYDGYYYSSDYLGVGSVVGAEDMEVTSITPIPGSEPKYEIVYDVFGWKNELYATCSAVIGMKESSNGFRFWSIYSLDVVEQYD